MAAPRSASRFLFLAILVLGPLAAAALYGPKLWARYRPMVEQAKSQLTIPRLVKEDERPERVASPRLVDADGGGGGSAKGKAAVVIGDAAPKPSSGGGAPGAETAEQRLAHLEEKALSHSTFIAPEAGKPNSSGEWVRRFQGFGVSVDSRPGGAQVLVNGEDKGETPLLTTVQCAVGAEVVIDVRKPGFKPLRRKTQCREDQLVELRVELK